MKHTHLYIYLLIFITEIRINKHACYTNKEYLKHRHSIQSNVNFIIHENPAYYCYQGSLSSYNHSKCIHDTVNLKEGGDGLLDKCLGLNHWFSQNIRLKFLYHPRTDHIDISDRNIWVINHYVNGHNMWILIMSIVVQDDSMFLFLVPKIAIAAIFREILSKNILLNLFYLTCLKNSLQRTIFSQFLEIWLLNKL